MYQKKIVWNPEEFLEFGGVIKWEP